MGVFDNVPDLIFVVSEFSSIGRYPLATLFNCFLLKATLLLQALYSVRLLVEEDILFVECI